MDWDYLSITKTYICRLLIYKYTSQILYQKWVRQYQVEVKIIRNGTMN